MVKISQKIDILDFGRFFSPKKYLEPWRKLLMQIFPLLSLWPGQTALLKVQVINFSNICLVYVNVA
jgi:hypothetical protein